jgi:drug/metabolite transporter (DMT)-like permease
VGAIASYAAALWAMTLAPVAVIAALRETSILFGTLISALLLRERVGPARLVAAGMIAAGAVLIRLA